jgi:hypothetical protein
VRCPLVPSAANAAAALNDSVVTNFKDFVATVVEIPYPSLVRLETKFVFIQYVDHKNLTDTFKEIENLCSCGWTGLALRQQGPMPNHLERIAT